MLPRSPSKNLLDRRHRDIEFLRHETRRMFISLGVFYMITPYVFYVLLSEMRRVMFSASGSGITMLFVKAGLKCMQDIFLKSTPFKVFDSIIGLHSVLVIYGRQTARIWDKRHCYKPMNQSCSSTEIYEQISLLSIKLLLEKFIVSMAPNSPVTSNRIKSFKLFNWLHTDMIPIRYPLASNYQLI